MNLDHDDDQAVFDELLNFLVGVTAGRFRIVGDGSVIELTGWRREDFATEPLRLHVTVSSVAQHLRDMEYRADLVFPNVQPIIGALQLFMVHLGEGIATRESGETELIPYPGGVRANPPDTSTLDRDDDRAVYDELLNYLRNEAEWDVRPSTDGSCIELTGWGREDFTAEPLRLRTTVSAIAEHLRDMEDGVDLVFPGVRPITGALRLFMVHVDEAIATRGVGETELFPYYAGVRSEQPATQ